MIFNNYYQFFINICIYIICIIKIQIPQETNVGKKLSDLTTRRVIMLVMSIMLSIPIFSLDTYIEEYTSYESGLRSIYMWYHTNSSSAAYNICLNTYISENSVFYL